MYRASARLIWRPLMKTPVLPPEAAGASAPKLCPGAKYAKRLPAAQSPKAAPGIVPEVAAQGRGPVYADKLALLLFRECLAVDDSLRAGSGRLRLSNRDGECDKCKHQRCELLHGQQ